MSTGGLVQGGLKSIRKIVRE